MDKSGVSLLIVSFFQEGCVFNLPPFGDHVVALVV